MVRPSTRTMGVREGSLYSLPIRGAAKNSPAYSSRQKPRLK